jgi:hypothetical protein
MALRTTVLARLAVVLLAAGSVYFPAPPSRADGVTGVSHALVCADQEDTTGAMCGGGGLDPGEGAWWARETSGGSATFLQIKWIATGVTHDGNYGLCFSWRIDSALGQKQWYGPRAAVEGTIGSFTGNLVTLYNSSDVQVAFETYYFYVPETGAGTQAACVNGDPGRPTGTDEDPGPETSDPETDCGAWWHLVCHLTRLFIPTSIGESMEDLAETAEASVPFGPIIWGLTNYADAMLAFRDGTELGAIPTCDWGPGLFDNEAYDDRVPLGGIRIPLGEVFCEDPEQLGFAGFETLRTWSRIGSVLAVGLGTVLAILRLFTWALGGSGSPVKSGGDDE